MSEKAKGLIVNLILYIAAFAAGAVPFALIDNIFLASALFTVVATLVIFIVTCFYPDTSLYDPYWSVAPPVILLAAMIKYRLFSVNAWLMLAFVLIWAVRLTGNWFITYKGLGHEDWRYAMYRAKCSKFVFGLINFFGLHYVPTIVVYAGLVGALFVIQTQGFNPLIFIGLAVMLTGVAFEFFADTSIHRFLRENAGKRKTCGISIWKYSRHPNYLGEMTFWTGIFIAFVLLRPDIWYYGLGFLLIIALFLSVSIPMMEKHNLERRPDYAEYKKKTSPLLLLPPKKNKGLEKISYGKA